MNCTEARLETGGDPRAMSPQLVAHLRACEACGAFRRELLTLDERIHRALADDPPLAGRATSRPRHTGPVRRWALAASAVLAVFAAIVFWGVRPGTVLARDVVEHVTHEPASWSVREPVPQPALDLVLRNAGVSVDASFGDVVYARTCPFRGREVPHIVVTTARGPVTVLLLPHERIPAARRIREHGYVGMLLPASGGAIAVLGRGDTDLRDIASRVERAVRWNPVSSARTR